MESMSPTFQWRGYINQITHGTTLSHRVDDSLVARLADELIRQRYFTLPVDEYYSAVLAALESGERLALTGDQDEEVTRDLLNRLLPSLDERRPWPEPPFHESDSGRWPEFRDAPIIGRISMTERRIGERLNRIFSERPTGGKVRVLILQLRTGQEVALLASPPFNEPGVDLLARTDPVSTTAAFHALTGIRPEVR